MRDREFGTDPDITLNGTALADSVRSAVVSVIVDQDLTSPTACEVTISDPGRCVLSDAGIDLGAEITIEASPVAERTTAPIFAGVVHSLDVTFGESGQCVVIGAYDNAFNLVQHRLSKSYNDSTVSDVIADLGSLVDVTVGAVEVDEVVFPHIGLFDETPWEFITRHAAASGCVVRYVEDELRVTKPTEATQAPDPGDHASLDAVQLVPGHNVTHLRVHSTTARQVGEIEVRGWDPAQKSEIVATSAAETISLDVEPEPAAIGSRYGSSLLVEPLPAIHVQARCDHHATAMADSLAAQNRMADGEAIGNPALSAGEVVSIGSVDSLSGKYLLTQCRHRFDDDGYATEFRCSGLHDRSLLGLMHDGSRSNRSGVYPAIVTDVADPGVLGRVKVRFPWLSDSYESAWARVCQVGAGADRGLLWFPEVDDEVVVAFNSGNSAAPVVLGGLFNGVDAPPFEGFVDDASGEVVIRGMKSRIGHAFVMTDTAGEESIKLESADGTVSVILDQSGRKLAMSTDGDVEVEAQGNLKLEASGDATIKSGGNLNLEGGGQVNVKGSIINLN